MIWTPDYIYGLRTLLKLFAPYLFLFGFLSFIKTDSDIKKSVSIIYSICLIVSCLAIINILSGGVFAPVKPIIAWGAIPCLAAPTTSPANFSFLMGCGAILAFGNYLESKRIGHLLVFIYLVIVVLWAFTRISLLGLVISTGVILSLFSKRRIVRLLVPVVMVLVTSLSMFTSESLKERMFYDTRKTDLSHLINKPEKFLENINTSGRLYLWEKANKNFTNREKIVGAGVGAVDHWLTKQVGVNALHSEYLRIYFDLGIIGLLLYVASIIEIAKRIMKVNKLSNKKSNKKWASVALAALIFYSITFFTDNSLNYVSDFGVYVYAFIAFCFISTNSYERDLTP